VTLDPDPAFPELFSPHIENGKYKDQEASRRDESKCRPQLWGHGGNSVLDVCKSGPYFRGDSVHFFLRHGAAEAALWWRVSLRRELRFEQLEPRGPAISGNFRPDLLKSRSLGGANLNLITSFWAVPAPR
jgi:hypothetical protein